MMIIKAACCADIFEDSHPRVLPLFMIVPKFPVNVDCLPYFLLCWTLQVKSRHDLLLFSLYLSLSPPFPLSLHISLSPFLSYFCLSLSLSLCSSRFLSPMAVLIDLSLSFWTDAIRILGQLSDICDHYYLKEKEYVL